MAEKENEGNVKQEYNVARTGLNLDQTLNQVDKGKLTYALNAVVENFQSNSINYQNELGNEFCVEFPEGFVLIGHHLIVEQNKQIFFITNPLTGESQIGFMENNDCKYQILVNDVCLSFDRRLPIQKIVHRITNCSTEIYWADQVGRRYLDIDNPPKKLIDGSPNCDPVYSDEIDCNQLKVQPDFTIPVNIVTRVTNGGNLIAGTYQFAVQYSDAIGNPYTSYYSITNPTPIADSTITTPNTNYPVGKSISVNISNLDTSGQYEYFNLAVIKSINSISSFELVGTYFIDDSNKDITYSGADQTPIKLSAKDIFEKFPYYELADDVTTAQDILIWSGLTSIDRINYQSIASKIKLQWETWRIPKNEDYSDELNATNLRGYLRDEVYAFEIVFLLKNGKQTDSFHIPGKTLSQDEQVLPRIDKSNPDFIGTPDQSDGKSAYWKIYNTAKVLGRSPEYTSEENYKGPYEYGEFAYWESEDEYPCNPELWGDLGGQKIRHHKFPDVSISPIYEGDDFVNSSFMSMGNKAIFPLGVKIDVGDIFTLINSSNLTQSQKDDIIGFKVVRGDRATNKSIVGKGILRNVGEYEREGQKFYFANYPYNDLKADPFLNSFNNAYAEECQVFNITVQTLAGGGANPYAEVEYRSCEQNKISKRVYNVTGVYTLSSVGKPKFTFGSGIIAHANYDTYRVFNVANEIRLVWDDFILGEQNEVIKISEVRNLVCVAGTMPVCIDGACDRFDMELRSEDRTSDPTYVENNPLNAFQNNSRHRQIFNSPETSFSRPFLGNVLKLESVIYGKGKAHFVEVKDNAKYKFISEEAQRKALDSASALGAITNPDFDAAAMFTAYQAYLTLYINGITRRNYAYSFNSIADYNYQDGIPDNQGVKQRELDIARYVNPGVQSLNDEFNINNYQRESSVYLRTKLDIDGLPYPDKSPNMLFGQDPKLTDDSRFTISQKNICNTPQQEQEIKVVSYYASLKNNISNQWGQIYSYDTIDTGYQVVVGQTGTRTVFGGDTFINRFAFKTKLPFFFDNRVNAPDDSDIFYDEIGNVAYPRYWHSSRSILKDYNITNVAVMRNLVSYKATNFDCPNDRTEEIVNTELDQEITYYDGYFYLFAYGIPNFYCESSYNLDLRQATNSREGDFFPHVSTDIPDDWFQENFVSINNDNTYNYNISYSKQNRENTFTKLPSDWNEKLCYTNYPFRAIYSDLQNIDSDNRINNWLIYRALSYFDFPQNHGDLISLDGIQNRAVLARFENKTLLYNSLLTIDTSNPQAAYIGNSRFFQGAPPIDFAETDLGYVGTQNKFILKLPQGQFTVDAKRGQIFLITGDKAQDITGFGSGMNRFFIDHLPFKILKSYPDIDIDNHYNGFGIHGVYDNKYNRVLITKIDYVPIDPRVKYNSEEQEFYIEEYIAGTIIKTPVYKEQEEYFCNKSFTLSFNMNTQSWISFHSYIPDFYIAENNFFYSGKNACCDDFEAVAVSELTPPPFLTTTTTTQGLTTTTTTDPFATTTTTLFPPTTTTTTLPITTTTTTYVIFPTTTTTTTIPIDCSFDGIITKLDCDIEGFGYRIAPTTTTTTTLFPPTTTTTSTSTTSTTTTTTTQPTVPTFTACADCGLTLPTTP